MWKFKTHALNEIQNKSWCGYDVENITIDKSKVTCGRCKRFLWHYEIKGYRSMDEKKIRSQTFVDFKER